RHPNTIAYPEKFFESAQAIAAHSHLRWPDLSREWIRRQQARIARGELFDLSPRSFINNLFAPTLFEASCCTRPLKSRLSLFTRKQQKLLNKAREMEGVPDLSALLKGKLQMLSTKSSSTGVSDSRRRRRKRGAVRPKSYKEGGGKAKKRIAKGEQSASLEESVPLVEAPSSADASKVSKKKKKKKDGKKRPREDSSIDQNEASTVVREDNTGAPAQTGSTEASPEERPKKRAKKKSVEEGARRSVDGDHPDDLPASEDPSRSGGKASGSEGDPRSESPLSERAFPTSATRKGVHSEGSLSKRARVEFPDRCLILSVRGVERRSVAGRGSCRIGELYFKTNTSMPLSQENGVTEYEFYLRPEAARITIRRGGVKLVRTRLSAIERLRAEKKKANEHPVLR
ncbi:hypothetical protein HID58_043231, partial [Brassica napus]